MHLHTGSLQDALCHRNLAFGLLAQTYADGVANAVNKQGADTHGTLQTTVLALSGLRYTQVQGIIHSLLLHLLAEQTDALHHHHRIAGLDADHHVGEMLTLTDTQELHAALHDARRRIAVTRHDTVRERAVIHADADSRSVLPADSQKAAETLIQSLQLLPVLLIRIFQMLELTGRIHIVARIDAHLLHDGGSHIRHIGIEVDIGTQGHITIAASHQSRLDVTQVLRLACSLRGKPNQVGPRINNTDTLFNAALGIHRAAGGHTLHGHPVLAANTQLAYLNLVCLSSHKIYNYDPFQTSPRGGFFNGCHSPSGEEERGLKFTIMTPSKPPRGEASF